MNVLQVMAMMAAVTAGASAFLAAGENASVTGTVRVTRRGDQVDTVRIDRGGKDKDYQVVLDNNGRRLAGQDGKAVSVQGTVARRDGVDWMTVTPPADNRRRRK